MTSRLARRLAEFSAELSLERVPERTRHFAKLLVLDAIGVALASSSFEFGRRAVRGPSSYGRATGARSNATRTFTAARRSGRFRKPI